MKRLRAIRWALFAAGILVVGSGARADGPDPREAKAVHDKAVEYLRKNQAPDGSFSAKFTGPGVTALVVAGMLRNGYPADDPTVEQG